MAHQPVFPIDIFESVIDQASDHASSLRQLSLICRSFHPRACYHLFSSISIRSVEQLHSAPEFLDTHPWIPPLVQKVSLSPGPLSSDHGKNVPLLDIVPVHIFPRLPNLLTWKLEIIGGPTRTHGPWLSFHCCALLCYRIYSGCIRNLELSNLHFDGMSHLRGLLSAFTAIQTVTCSNVRFRTKTENKHFVYRSGSSMLTPRSLTIRRLHVGDSVEFRVVRYLLASSRATLNDLMLTVTRDVSDAHLRRGYSPEAPQTILLSQLSSLTLVLPYHGNSWTNLERDQVSSFAIEFAIRVLEVVERPHMCDVRVEFRLFASSFALIGSYLSRPNIMSQVCKPLEEALLYFHRGRVSFHGSAGHSRAGRAAFWLPAFKSAFSRLDERGLLDVNAGVNADAQDPIGHEGPVNVMVASYDSKWIATGSMDGTIIVWDAERGTIVHEWLAHQGFSVDALCFSPDSQSLVSAGGPNYQANELAVRHVGADGVDRAAKLAGHMRIIKACTWCPNGTLIASKSEDGTVRVWDALTFQQVDLVYQNGLNRLNRYQGNLLFSPDSRYLAWTSSVGCSVWRPLSGEAPKPLLPGKGFGIYALSFNTEGSSIATAHRWESPHSSYIVKIWDTPTGTMLAVLAGHARAITYISFSPDGRSILSASLDGFAKVWDIESGAETATVRVDEEDTNSMPASATVACFSPDGKFVVTVAESSSTVKLWRTDNASCVVEFIGHKDAVISHVVFSPNGEFLASADVRGIVVIRRFPSSLRY